MPRRTPQRIGELDQGQLRLLRWLERYPFQRGHDLVVALSPWLGRSAVYRRVADLEERHLVEAVSVGAAGRERLYHLSPIGTHACHMWHHAHETHESAAPLTLREERERFVRLLPRLPVWLVIQDLVKSLVVGAAQALVRAGTGERAEVVRWNWLRDYSHAFVPRGQPERVLRVRADGALALCFRFPSSAHPRALQEQWQTFLLMHCPLDEMALPKRRLDRVLRWRESEERWPMYDQMPPVLILATTPRQAEWWHRAWTHVATTWKMDGPVGAVVSLEGHPIEDGWRLPWRNVGTNASCHLRDLVYPRNAPALPELVEAPSVWTAEAETVWHAPPYAGRFSYALATKAQQFASSARQTPQSVSSAHHVDYRLLSLLLTPRQWEILALCVAHPLGERDELSVWLGLRSKPVQILLTDLAHKGLLICRATTCGGRWHLTDAGLRLLARATSCHVHRLARLPVTPGVPLQQRGVAGLLHQLSHTAGIYAFFTDLMRGLADLPEACVRWWETGAPCEQVFTYREQVYHFKPDALACVQIGARTIRFWLEWDRGTMGMRDLERKCATYAAYLVSREWASMGTSPPALVYVAPEIAQERRFLATATALLAHISTLHLVTTTASLLATRGVLAPIWQRVNFQGNAVPQTPLEYGRRVAFLTKLEDEGTLESPFWETSDRFSR